MKSKLPPPFRFPFFSRHVRKPFHRRTAPGAQPGTVIIDPESPKPKIHVIAYGDDGVEENDAETVADLAKLLHRKPVTWVNVDGLGDAAVIQQLGELFGLHGLVLEDIVNVHQRSKLEEYDEYLYIVVREATFDTVLHTEQVSIILGDGFVLTVQEWPGDCFEPVRQRIRKRLGRIRNAGPDHLAYALIDSLIDSYFPVLEKYGEELERVEERLLAGVSATTIARIHRLRSELFILRKTIWPHRDTINELLRDTTNRISEETRVYLRDCYDHSIQIIDVTETCREMCSDLRDFQFAQVSVRQNEVMKVLTIVSTIFIPLSFIAGVYGMNFDPKVSPWNMPELRWWYGYPFALGVMAAMGIALLGFIWRRGWLGREPTVEQMEKKLRRQRNRRSSQVDDSLSR
ncbi:MAG: magnesium/cobalt transporter CorA [Planctomycetaceae bacterium]